MTEVKRYFAVAGSGMAANYYTDTYADAEEALAKLGHATEFCEILFGTPGHWNRLEDIAVDGHRGTWYVIDAACYDGSWLFLLESEVYGDEAACLIVDEDFAVVMDDVWNGFDDYDESLKRR